MRQKVVVEMQAMQKYVAVGACKLSFDSFFMTLVPHSAVSPTVSRNFRRKSTHRLFWL